jgi:hypothetical protein
MTLVFYLEEFYGLTLHTGGYTYGKIFKTHPISYESGNDA